MPLSATDKKELLNNIATLGGKGIHEEDIVYEGVKFVLPESFRNNPKGALAQIQKKFAELEEPAEFSRVYNYRPWDGAYCAYKAFKKAFGIIRGETIPGGFFSPDQPPRYIQVPTGVDSTEEVPWGVFSIPVLDKTTITFHQTNNPDYGPVFAIQVEAPRKYKDVVQGLFEMVDAELLASSIYRGKAIDGQDMPQFLALDGVDPTKVIYSEDVLADLEASIWGVFRYGEANAAVGLPSKRAILLAGPYGTGKSLAGYLTAREAVANGWTFIMVRPGRDNLMQSMQTARLYQPACVFFEDADVVTDPDSGDADMTSRILDMFDGIQAKGSKLMVVMTTNHPDRIHKGMHRPGRIDAHIEIGALDDSGIRRLIEASVPSAQLDLDIDWKAVCMANESYVPAFVGEAAQRAVRYALARTHGNVDGMLITSADLVHAANSLRAQYNHMIDAPEAAMHEKPLGTVVRDAVVDGMLAVGSPSYALNAEAVEELERRQRNGHKVTLS